RVQLERHLAQCAECARILGQIRNVVAWAPTYQGSQPSRDLWPAVESQLPPLGSSVERRARDSWFGRRISIRVPHLIAAGIALVILSSGVMWLAREKEAASAALATTTAPREWSTFKAAATEAQYDQAIAQLESILAAGDSALEPGTLKVIRESLNTIDRAILDARQAIARDSNNSYLNASIAMNMRRKLDILRTAAQAVAAKS
ncbi:MAG: hypothetical protein ABI679_13280, partial [Gemmatimonadota bacterium]